MSSKVLLVSMPFGPITSPSIGLSLLKESLKGNGFSAEIIYLNLLFAQKVGVPIYNSISSGYPVNHDMVGEWIFSNCLFEDKDCDVQYIQEVLLGGSSAHNKEVYGLKKIDQKFIDLVKAIKYGARDFIDEAANIILKKNPCIIGFTSVFQQQLASLAVAKRLKSLDGNLIICMGGANNEGVMGSTVIEKFPFIDYVVSGEGENTFSNLLLEISKKKEPSNLAGVFSNANRLSSFSDQSKARSIVNVNHLPFVNYDDYVEQLNGLSIKNDVTPRIPFETSRGCWWGMKNHCTFCGLNGENMTQRTKSWQRALAELEYLLDKYPAYPISVVDNILDYKYFKDFIPALIELRKKKKYELFYEVKANLTKQQLQMLKDAGITIIQPGIESFCKKTLKIMRKGVSPIQNVQLLKWCKELGIKVEWNLLYGFPGESSEEYKEVKKISLRLFHLDPPNGCAPIRLDRFSPNFDQSEQLGFVNIKPYPTYNYIYPFENQDIHNLAYFFTYEILDKSLDAKAVRSFKKVVSNWKEKHSESVLFYSDNGDYLLIWDLRSPAKDKVFLLDGFARSIYLICDKAMRYDQLSLALNSEYATDLSNQLIKDKITLLLDNNLLIAFDDFYLSLAVSDAGIELNEKTANRLNQLMSSESVEDPLGLHILQPIFA